jgi:hypothetical protein
LAGNIRSIQPLGYIRADQVIPTDYEYSGVTHPPGIVGRSKQL